MTAPTTRPAGYGCPRCDHAEMAVDGTRAAADAAIDAMHWHLMRTHVWARSTAYRLLTELRPLTAQEAVLSGANQGAVATAPYPTGGEDR